MECKRVIHCCGRWCALKYESSFGQLFKKLDPLFNWFYFCLSIEKLKIKVVWDLNDMAHKSNTKRKTQDNDKYKENRKTTAHDDIESLQITFYEIESWIEKTTPILTRMTKELDKASGHFDHSKRKKKEKAIAPMVDQSKLEQQLLQLQQQQLLWKKSILCNQEDNNNGTSTTMTEIGGSSSNNPMQWNLSFQPGNLLRLDTNITSVEQLIDAVQKIRLMQTEEPSTIPETEEEDMKFEIACSSPASSSTSQPDVSYVEYWFNALGRRPKIALENYKHCRMNLNGLTKNISPQVLNYIGSLCWDCLHPKFSTDWATFWERPGDARKNQVCIDSGLANIFLHVIRHDKDACNNAQEIAGFYYDRARDALMEFFDDPPDCATIEALLNMTVFCITCKRYSQAKIYIGLCLHMIIECRIHKLDEIPADDLLLRRKHLKLLLILYFNDFNLSVFIGEPALINDTELNIDFFELIETNKQLLELNLWNFDNNKTISKETYFVYTVELGRISKQTQILISRNATTRQLLALERPHLQWLQSLPDWLRPENHDYNMYETKKIQKDSAIQKDYISVVDSATLDAQAALLLKINYEAQTIILHKAVLTSIRQANSSPSSAQLEEEIRSNTICSNAADAVVAIAEVISRCFGWCVCQQVVTCLYQASTVYCGQALVKNNLELRNKAKEMIHRIMRVLDAGGANHEGFPDDMTECLCEFLTNHGMHNDNVECSCTVVAQNTPGLSASIVPTLGPLDGVGIINNGFTPTYKHLKKLRHISNIVLEDSP